jgi:hypothetical protein
MFRAFLVILFLTVSGPVLAEDPRFFSELSDIPLMPGLFELTDETVVFDKPEGRIVETAAASETENMNKIKAFYDSALPQLGWARAPLAAGAGDYIRQDEALSLRVESRGGLNVLKLMVSPR